MNTFFDDVVSDDNARVEAASEKLSDQLGTVAAVGSLVGTTIMQADEVKIIFSQQLSKIVRTSTSDTLLQRVAKVLGDMAKGSTSTSSQYIEHEIAQISKGLEEEPWHRRLAACLVMRELALNAPFSVHLHMEDFIIKLSHVVLDSRLEIRTTAAESLKICLKISNTWPATNLLVLHWRIYYKAYNVLERLTDRGSGRATEAEADGSMLIILALLDCTGKFLLPRVGDVFKRVLHLKGQASSRLVTETAMSLLIQLARYEPYAFIFRHLKPTLKYLYDCCQSRTDQSLIAFKTLGELALGMGADHLEDEVHNLVQTLLSGLTETNASGPWRTTSRREKATCFHAAMECLAKITTVLKGLISPHLPRLLNALCSHGPSKQKRKTLAVLMDTLPAHTPNIQQRILRDLSTKLYGEPYRLQFSIQPWLR